MSLAQLHYTSAPRGGADAPGAGFTAVTPGVPRELLGEAERLLAYEPPRDAPPHPSAAELAAFPAALSHSLLPDGSRLLARAVCTGVDHSGRWCAFHAHAVVIPPNAELPGGALPFATWEAPQWASAAPLDGHAVPPAAFDAAPAPGGQQRRKGRGANRRPSGRERHDEKITVYVSAEELMDLEHARLVLRGEHGLAVDRGRIVREAVAVVLADLESRGDASILVRRLRGR
ncbi:GAP1-N2 domain-containing protein [Streptomyces montanisoli]|uniref:GAP1-N2 domain-containing protein n=1 Tax=Streptomyces montanisoli TaxID=2798581 RepID=UPI001FD77FC8|nr:hypothetical protein [Streptomyces montanisoli]